MNTIKGKEEENKGAAGVAKTTPEAPKCIIVVNFVGISLHKDINSKLWAVAPTKDEVKLGAKSERQYSKFASKEDFLAKRGDVAFGVKQGEFKVTEVDPSKVRQFED